MESSSVVVYMRNISLVEFFSEKIFSDFIKPRGHAPISIIFKKKMKVS